MTKKELPTKKKVGRPKKKYTDYANNGIGRPPKTTDELPKNWEKKMIDLSKKGYFEVELRVHALDCLSSETFYKMYDNYENFRQVVNVCKELRAAHLYSQGRAGLFDSRFKDSHWNRLMMNTQTEWKYKSEEVNLNVSNESSLDITDRIQDLIKSALESNAKNA